MIFWISANENHGVANKRFNLEKAVDHGEHGGKQLLAMFSSLTLWLRAEIMKNTGISLCSLCRRGLN